MYAHVHHKGVVKKGANNVELLIMEMLWQLNLLHKYSARSELNIIFDNCLLLGLEQKQYSIEAGGMDSTDGLL